MATIEFEGLDEYIKKLTMVGVKVEGIIKSAVYPAAGMVIDEIKANCPVRSGDLRDSMALVTFKNENGYVYTEVVFPGYDREGVPNAVKARVLESGSSKQQKHPFIRPAINRVKEKANAMMQSEFEEKVEKMME